MFHDKEIIGILYRYNEEYLEFLLENNEKIIFTNVIFCDFDWFTYQNVIFSIDEYSAENLPEYSAHIKEYMTPDTVCYNVVSSIGLNGNIISRK